MHYEVILRFAQLTALELQYVSPKLLSCRNLELAVPGTYDPNRPLVKIRAIGTNLQVITSKQRPRKVCIKGEPELYKSCYQYTVMPEATMRTPP